MSDLNYFDPYKKDPAKKNVSNIVIIALVVLSVIIMVYFLVEKIAAYNNIKHDLAVVNEELKNMDEGKLAELARLEARLADIRLLNGPVCDAYIAFKSLHTVNRSLFENYCLKPILSQNNPFTFNRNEKLNLSMISVTANSVIGKIGAKDSYAIADYEEAIRGMMIPQTEEQKQNGEKPESMFFDIWVNEIIGNDEEVQVYPVDGTFRYKINTTVDTDLIKQLKEIEK